MYTLLNIIYHKTKFSIEFNIVNPKKISSYCFLIFLILRKLSKEFIVRNKRYLSKNLNPKFQDYITTFTHFNSIKIISNFSGKINFKLLYILIIKIKNNKIV